MNRCVWAVVVARLGATAKSRLAPVLTGEQRALLARAMLADVLAAVQGAGLPTLAVLASDGPAVGQASGGLWWDGSVGQVVPDPGGGMNAAVSAGIRAAMDAGADRVLVLPGDVPLARAEDIRAVLSAAGSESRGIGLVRDRWRAGTNALLLVPPDLVPPSFGATSADRHIGAAQDIGVMAIDLHIPRLELDVDTPADLADLLVNGPGGQVAAALHLLGYPRAGALPAPGARAESAVAPSHGGR